jgi:hypothetical protein
MMAQALTFRLCGSEHGTRRGCQYGNVAVRVGRPHEANQAIRAVCVATDMD